MPRCPLPQKEWARAQGPAGVGPAGQGPAPQKVEARLLAGWGARLPPPQQVWEPQPGSNKLCPFEPLPLDSWAPGGFLAHQDHEAQNHYRSELHFLSCFKHLTSPNCLLQVFSDSDGLVSCRSLIRHQPSWDQASPPSRACRPSPVTSPAVGCLAAGSPVSAQSEGHGEDARMEAEPGPLCARVVTVSRTRGSPYTRCISLPAPQLTAQERVCSPSTVTSGVLGDQSHTPNLHGPHNYVLCE